MAPTWPFSGRQAHRHDSRAEERLSREEWRELEPLPWCKNVVLTEAEATEPATLAWDATDCEQTIVNDAGAVEDAGAAPAAELTGTATALSLVSELYDEYDESDEDG